jgi:hypothetical protein
MTPQPSKAVKPVARAKVVGGSSRFYLPATDVERNYAFLVGGAAGVVFLARFLTDGPPAALCFLVPAAVGFFFRWRRMPALAVFLLGYFLAAPALFPPGPPESFLFRLGHFDVMNMILITATIVYLAAQYRLFSIVGRAMPGDLPGVKRSDPDPHLRKIDAIPGGEWLRLFLIAGGCVVAAEFFFLCVTELYVEPALSVPVRLAGAPLRESSGLPGELPPPISRLILAVVPFAVLFAAARFLFWYWRLSRLTPEEGAGIVADGGWAESRRESLRNETFRARALARMNRDEP